MSPAAGLSARAIEIVASLAAHRSLSTAQIRVVHMPEAGLRRTQQVMARIAAAGLAGAADSTGSPQRLWFATEAGARAAEASGALPRAPRLFEAREVVGPLKAHTVAVNEAAISFLVAARGRGEDFGPLAWRHEVTHPLRQERRGRRARAVIADAVLTYLRLAGHKVRIEQRFLELDRATLSVDAMAAELARYGELFRAMGKNGTPIWRSRYPAFPAVICVLAGARREVLTRRRDIALALMRSEPQMTLTPEVEIRICLLEDLVAEGPYAPIFRSLRDPGRALDWLGQKEEEA